jgi:hypothetical protein
LLKSYAEKFAGGISPAAEEKSVLKAKDEEQNFR